MKLKIFNLLVWLVASCLKHHWWFRSFTSLWIFRLCLRWLLVITHDFKMFFAVFRLSCFRLFWLSTYELKKWVGFTMFGSFTLFRVVLCCFRSFYVLWVVEVVRFFFFGRGRGDASVIQSGSSSFELFLLFRLSSVDEVLLVVSGCLCSSCCPATFSLFTSLWVVVKSFRRCEVVHSGCSLKMMHVVLWCSCFLCCFLSNQIVSAVST